MLDHRAPNRTRVSVIGAGNGGLAVAGYIASRGYRVTVYDNREEALVPLQQQGGIRMTGKVDGFAPLARITSVPREAVEGAGLVILVVPGPDQGDAARALAPFLRDTEIVLVKPGCTGGALEVRAVLAESGCEAVVAETDAFLFACSVPEPGVSTISAVKDSFGVAAIPAGETGRVVAALESVFPQAEPAESVLHTGLTNMNSVLHVAPMIANAGRIDAGCRFDFYGQGFTVSVVRAVRAYDAERLAVATALGICVPTVAQWIERTYGVVEDNLLATIERLHREVYGASPAPRTLHHRYLTEDVSCGAVPVAGLGAALGVPVPLHESLIQLASLLCEVDFARTGRTVDRLGLRGLTADEIRRKVWRAA